MCFDLILKTIKDVLLFYTKHKSKNRDFASKTSRKKIFKLPSRGERSTNKNFEIIETHQTGMNKTINLLPCFHTKCHINKA